MVEVVVGVEVEVEVGVVVGVVVEVVVGVEVGVGVVVVVGVVVGVVVVMKKLHLKLTVKQFETLRKMMAYSVKASQSLSWEHQKDWELLERAIIGQSKKEE